MTTTYNPAEVERLVREARTPALRPDDAEIDKLRSALDRKCADTPVAHLAHDAQATLWQLQQIANRADANLRAMADQLEAARARIAELEAKLVDLQGRKLGNGDAWAEAASEATGMYDYQRKLHEAMKATIRSLLDTELPAGELRKAVGELVK